MISWEAAGALGEILGAIAVVGSLVFVGTQFRQASNQTLQLLWQQTVDNFTANGENARIIALGNEKLDELSPSERFQYGGFLMNLLNAVSLIWEQHQKGLFSDRSYRRVLDTAAFYYIQPGFQALLDGSLYGFESNLEIMNASGFPREMFKEIENVAVEFFGWIPNDDA